MAGVEIPDRGFGAEAVRAAGVAGWAVLPALRLRRRVAFPREGPKVAGRPLRVQPLRGPVHRHYHDPDALHEAPVKGMASCPVLDPQLLEGRVVRDPREAARSQA